MLLPVQATSFTPPSASVSSESSSSSTPSSSGIYSIHQHYASHPCLSDAHNDALQFSVAPQDEDDDPHVSFDDVVDYAFCCETHMIPHLSACLHPLTKSENNTETNTKIKINTNHVPVIITNKPNATIPNISSSSSFRTNSTSIKIIMQTSCSMSLINCSRHCILTCHVILSCPIHFTT